MTPSPKSPTAKQALAGGSFEEQAKVLDRYPKEATIAVVGHEPYVSALLARVEQAVRALGGRLLIVETSGQPEYESARRFYAAHGYRREALIADFYDVGDDLWLYSKRLD